jgi:hypothetical protein
LGRFSGVAVNCALYFSGMLANDFSLIGDTSDTSEIRPLISGETMPARNFIAASLCFDPFGMPKQSMSTML